MTSSKSRRQRTHVLYVMLLTLLYVGAQFVSGGRGQDILDSFIQKVNEALEAAGRYVMSFLIYILTRNPRIYPPATADPSVSQLMPVILGILYPAWIILLILSGIQFIWASYEPAKRAQAKQRIWMLIVGMVITGLSAPIFQLILDVEAALVEQTLSFAGITPAMFGVGAAVTAIATIVGAILVWLGVALGPILCCILPLIFMPFFLLAGRYLFVIVLAILFPVTLFLFFFEFTRGLGVKLFRYTIIWIFIPVVMAVILVIMLRGLESFSTFSGITGTAIGGALALAGFALMSSAPLMMTGLMNTLGGAIIHAGYTTGNTRIRLLGYLMAGGGPSALTDYAYMTQLGRSGLGEYGGTKYSYMEGVRKGLEAARVGQPPTPGWLDDFRVRREEIGRINQGIREAKKAGDTQRVRELKQDKKYTRWYGTRMPAAFAGLPPKQLRQYTTPGQRLRHMLEANEAARKAGKKAPYSWSDVHTARWGYRMMPFSPTQLVKPFGQVLEGVVTHIVPGKLEKSLMELSRKMHGYYETVEVTNEKGEKKKVVAFRYGWQRTGDMAKDLADFAMEHPIVTAGGIGLGASLVTPGLAAPIAFGALGVGVARSFASALGAPTWLFGTFEERKEEKKEKEKTSKELEKEEQHLEKLRDTAEFQYSEAQKRFTKEDEKKLSELEDLMAVATNHESMGELRRIHRNQDELNACDNDQGRWVLNDLIQKKQQGTLTDSDKKQVQAFEERCKCPIENIKSDLNRMTDLKGKHGNKKIDEIIRDVENIRDKEKIDDTLTKMKRAERLWAGEDEPTMPLTDRERRELKSLDFELYGVTTAGDKIVKEGLGEHKGYRELHDELHFYHGKKADVNKARQEWDRLDVAHHNTMIARMTKKVDEDYKAGKINIFQKQKEFNAVDLKQAQRERDNKERELMGVEAEMSKLSVYPVLNADEIKKLGVKRESLDEEIRGVRGVPGKKDKYGLEDKIEEIDRRGRELDIIAGDKNLMQDLLDQERGIKNKENVDANTRGFIDRWLDVKAGAEGKTLSSLGDKDKAEYLRQIREENPELFDRSVTVGGETRTVRDWAIDKEIVDADLKNETRGTSEEAAAGNISRQLHTKSDAQITEMLREYKEGVGEGKQETEIKDNLEKMFGDTLSDDEKSTLFKYFRIMSDEEEEKKKK